MIVGILVILTMIAVAMPVVHRLDPAARGRLLIGEAVLLGTALPAMVLFILSLIGIQWSAIVMTIGTLLVAAVAVGVPSRRGLARSSQESVEPVTSANPLAIFIHFFALVLIVGYGLFATLVPSEADFVTNWGLKARAFWHHGGIDWALLSSRDYAFIHPDYPLLLPLVFDSISLGSGRWNESAFGLFYVSWGVAALLLIGALIETESGSPLFAALVTLTLLPMVMSPYIGLGEGPLIAYGTSGVLLIRRGIRQRYRNSILVGALLLGLASQSKNEGLTLGIAALASYLIAVRRPVRELWLFSPLLLIAAPWLLLRWENQLATDLAEGNVVTRIFLHLKEPELFFEAMARYPVGKPLFWVGLVFALFLTLRYLVAQERFTLGTLAIQYVFLLGAYLATPHSLDWHFRWSWERVVNQMTPLLTFVVLVGLAPLLISGKTSRVTT